MGPVPPGERDDGYQLANGLLDISAGGLQVLAKEPLYPWEAVDIVLSSGMLATPIHRRGEVR